MVAKVPCGAIEPSGDKERPLPPHRHTSEHELNPDDKPRQRLARTYASVVKRCDIKLLNVENGE